MRSRSQLKNIFVLAIVSTTALFGCELIVDFDRTLIVSEEIPEAGPTDATPVDTGVPSDATTDATDSSTTDTGTDAADAGSDVADASDSG